jgi:hypothetical protein
VKLFTSVAISLAVAGLGVGLAGQAQAARVEETVLGATDAGGILAVSPNGGRVAYLARAGKRFTLQIDGVPGPEFDGILKSSGRALVSFPEKVLITESDGSRNAKESPVLFSHDGQHVAYVGLQGKEYVVMHDGREIGRGPWDMLEARGYSLSYKGRYVYWFEFSVQEGKSFRRVVVSGQPGPWFTDRVVLPRFGWEEQHYYYALNEIRDVGPGLLLDGKILGYVGARPEITNDGNLLSVGSAPEGESLLLNGQVVATGTKVVDITPAFVGPRYAAIIQQIVEGQPVNRLFLDGKWIPAGDHVTRVTFSSDGQRYAARLERPSDKQLAALIDGRRGGFAPLKNAFSLFTADSTAVVSYVEHDDDAISVFAAQKQYNYRGGFTRVTLSPKGNRQAWAGYSDAGQWEVIVNGQSCLPKGLKLRFPDDRYLGEHDVTFSPDGSRHAFTAVTAERGGINRLVVDGQVVPDVVAGVFEDIRKVFYLTGTTVEFSDGGRHLAYVGKTATSPNPVLYIDHVPVYRGATAMYFPTFSADQNHFSWIADEPADSGRPASTVVYVDGEPAVRTNIDLFRSLSSVFSRYGEDGLAVLGVDGNVVKRYRVTPASVRTIASMKPLVELPAPPAAALTSLPQPPSSSSPAETTPRDAKTPAAPATALPALIKAAADGDVIQQLKLGRMYRDGSGGVKDPIKAYFYFPIAAARGSKEATAERDEISGTMTGEQRRIGFNDAYDWLMSHPVSR